MIDNNTGKYLRTVPIFDNGNSILSFLEEDNDAKTYRNYTSKFDTSFDILSKNLVTFWHKEGLQKLKIIRFQRHPVYNLPERILQKGEVFI